MAALTSTSVTPTTLTSRASNAAATAHVRRAPWIALGIALWAAVTWLVGLRQGLLFAVGIGYGAVLAAVSFGFTTGWRAWIRDRDPTGLLAQFLAIALAMVIGIPLIAGDEALSGAIAPLSVSLVLGAFVFGAVMQIADGCGSGTLYKAGLGNVFSLAVLPGFIAGSFLGAAHLDAWLALGSLEPVALPEKIGVAGTLALQLALLGGLAAWLWSRRKATDTRWKGRGIYVAAICMALFAVLNLVIAGQPWGIVYGLGLWGAKVATWLGMDLTANAFWGRPAQQAHITSTLLTDVTSITNLGLLFGAFVAAHWRGTDCQAVKASGRQWLAGIVSGLLLGYSSRLAFGCNVGGYFSGISTGSLHGWVWFAAAFAGSLAGVRLRAALGFKA
ncbi:MAG: YeeE/YedE family protein [Burkholderiaceae bacterium]|nr:YeeE/YedE family protein [Burkholderiaceae bacterium]